MRLPGLILFAAACICSVTSPLLAQPASAPTDQWGLQVYEKKIIGHSTYNRTSETSAGVTAAKAPK
jgi:hypothetical protein